MASPDDKVRDLIGEEAAEWFVANRESLTPTERQALVAWLRTSPLHVEEYLAHSVIARDLPKACVYSEEALAELVERARTQPDAIAPSSKNRRPGGVRRIDVPRWRAVAVAAACAAAAIGWVALRNGWANTPTAPREAIAEVQLSTHHGEQRSYLPDDNSVLHLNTDSAATVRYNKKERLVLLRAGEADFEVIHDNRLFKVVAGTTQVIDRGTKFDVLLGHDGTVVTVVEGRVAVSPSLSPGPQEVAVGGDHQVTVIEGVWPPAQPVAVDAQRATAWLRRQIAFDHAPLDKVAAEFNRYAPKPIEIVSPGLQKLEISGVFTTDDPAAFIAFLRSLDSVRVGGDGHAN